MIEITYHTSDESGEKVVIKPPKNIRQIGSPRGRHKIYVEDYVHTYLHSSLFFGENQQRAAILLGRSEVSQEIRYTFIEGAINCEDFVFQKEGIIFDESCWEYIYQEMKQYFDQQMIVGWFLGRPGFPLKVSHAVEAAQRKYFSGRDKVLYLWDPQEGEDIFFAYEQGSFQRKEGYYVYYEKNIAMQEYMVCQREKSREEQGGILEMSEICSREDKMEISADEREPVKKTGDQIESPKEDSELKENLKRDRNSELEKEAPDWDMPFGKGGGAKGAADVAIGNYRSMLKEREKKQSFEGKNLFLYGAATVALIAVCLSGVVNLNSYQKMKQMEEALTMITKPLEEQLAEAGKADEQKESQQGEQKITVQTVSGEVERQDAGTEKTPQEGGTLENQDQAGGGEQPSGQEGTSTQPSGQGEVGGAQSSQGSGEGDAAQPSQGSGEENAAQPSQGSGEGDAAQPSGLPDSGQSEANSQEAMVQSYLDQGYYVVQPGDSLESICNKIYQKKDMMEKLCEINQITDVNKILVGQKLILP